MKKKSDKLFAEIKDQEIRYAVFEQEENLDYNLLLKKNSKNNGIKNGTINDLELASETVLKDLKDIEKNVNKIFETVNLIINQREMSSTNLTSFKKLNGAKVEKRDLDYILNEGKISISKNDTNNSVIHILNTNFYIDKKKREKIPLNIFGDHLGLQMTFVSLPNNNIKNVKSLFENNDLKVDRLLCRPLVTGVNLTTDNNLRNFSLLSIDDESSTISIYENSSLVFIKTFSFGTNSIYRDLSQLCSIKNNDVMNILNEINFNKKIESINKHIDRKFFKESHYAKLSLQHFRKIIESRIEEMMNYLFNKNSNISYFKSKLSHVYLVFENDSFKKNLGELFSEHLSFNSQKVALRILSLDDLPLLGAAELTYKGWHAEAIPYVNQKKSLFGRLFSRFFN